MNSEKTGNCWELEIPHLLMATLLALPGTHLKPHKHTHTCEVKINDSDTQDLN